MKTKTIFKTLAMAMMMPAMMLTTACSSDDDAIVNNPENNNQKGYALPVTVNVTRQGDATTRAEYNESTKKLAFSTGDQLFVKGSDATAGQFAGTLEWVSEGTFSGTIYTENSYSGTAVALLGSATTPSATLLPSGYESLGYLTVSGDGYGATLTTDATKAFATSKAAAVEQLSLEQASAYSDGFALAPQNAILNFTSVTGNSSSYVVTLQAGETTVSSSVTPVYADKKGTATFAMAVAGGTTPSLTLTVDGTLVSLGSHALTAGRIYNQKLHNVAVTPNSIKLGRGEKWIVYGTAEEKNITVYEGAAVTLYNVNLSLSTIEIYDDATIILADGTTNTITADDNYPAIQVDENESLIIQGTGELIATGGSYNPAIGAFRGYEGSFSESCGNITIANTVQLTATAGEGYDKAITTNGGGKLTIGDKEYPVGAPSPFGYPTTTVKWDFSKLSGTYDVAGYVGDGVKLEGIGQISFDDKQLDAWDGITITNTLGKKFTRIVIYGKENSVNIYGDEGWSNADDNSSATWTGNSESVNIGEGAQAGGITSIVFTLEDVD